MKSRIADGTYLPGQRIPSVKMLAEEIGVSMSTVREGIRVMTNIGLIRAHQGRGVFVMEDARLVENPLETIADVEDSTLFHILEVRRIIEPEIAALAAERASKEQINAMLDLALEQEEEQRLTNGDPTRSELGFHWLVLDAAQNPIFDRMMRSVDKLILDSRRRSGKILGTYAKSVHFHHLIALAIESRDQEQARRLMSEHILDVIHDVKRYLENPDLAEDGDNEE